MAAQLNTELSLPVQRLAMVASLALGYGYQPGLVGDNEI
jgi:hypothetical protein